MQLHRLTLRAAALAATLVAAQPALALDVLNSNGFYPCIQGDCVNGRGTVRELMTNADIEGNWRGGQTIPGERYTIGHPLAKGKRYEQYYGSDGMLERGSVIRGVAASNIVSVFTGTFGRVDHTFMRARIASPQEGVYALGNGIEYRGRFEYLPAKGHTAGQLTMGHFIFFGDKVDTEDNETETGLWVSQQAVVGGAPFMLVRARPDYMAVLQQQYQREQSLATDDFRAQDQQKTWATAFSILGEVAGAMGGRSGGLGGMGGGRGSAGRGFAMDLIGGLMSGAAQQQGQPAQGATGGSGGAAPADPSARLIQMITGSALKKVTGDKALSDALSKAVADGIEKANAGKP
ncbi:MAG: hypothetical protein IPK34_16235 [Ramlibacter sp.]|nr:hypothetical protein [Ramlibacter sp.]